jgi:transcriptional regulator
MYLHPAFKIDMAKALPILRQRAFGLFVVPTSDAPFGVHVPFLVEETSDAGLRIALHVARANPIHSHMGDGCKALLACSGPDAYVSPDWYGSENQVPSWIYTAVHIEGTAKIMPRETHLEHVDRLSAEFENRLAPKAPWNSEKMDAKKRAAMLTAIVAITIDVEAIHAQKKLVQHKSAAEQMGAVTGLRGRGDAGSLALAEMMQAGPALSKPAPTMGSSSRSQARSALSNQSNGQSCAGSFLDACPPNPAIQHSGPDQQRRSPSS